jgi:hypothetical protein
MVPKCGGDYSKFMKGVKVQIGGYISFESGGEPRRGTIEIRKGTVAVVSPTPLAAPGKAGKPAKTLPVPKAKLVENEKKEVDWLRPGTFGPP